MKRIIGILCGLFFFLFSFAQETFQKETYISSRGDTLLYRLLRPEVMNLMKVSFGAFPAWCRGAWQ